MDLIMSEVKLNIDLSSAFELKYFNEKDLTNINFFENYDNIFFVCSRRVAKKLFDINLHNLKFIQLTSAGYDSVPIKEFSERGVIISSAGDTYTNTIAESVLLNLLLFVKRYRNNPNRRHPRFFRKYEKYIDELAGKKVLILGAGSIGKDIAKKFYGLNLAVDCFTRTKIHSEYFQNVITERRKMIELLKQYDVIVSTLPLNESTNNFINKEIIDNFSANCIFINISRDSVYDKDYLYESLKERRIKGAILDKLEIFPNCITNKFRRLSNVINLPGTAAISKQTKSRLQLLIQSNIKCMLSNKTPKNIVKGE